MTGKAQKTGIFKTRGFDRFARKEGIDDAALCRAIRNAEQGQIDADLGGGVIKQRIARPNEGKSGGYRSIVLFRSGDKAFFAYGFAKNRQGNIKRDELQGFRDLADEMLGYDSRALSKARKSGAIIEVTCDEKDISK
ncbi:MAG: type II toxin-antitoxin system RelE/ParE family toxin [Sneathiella sp.]